MKLDIIKHQELEVKNWSGGTTTQLAIYPRDAEYALRNFQFRVSTARCENETSSFTPLPGVARVIMVLDGELQLQHIARYGVTLQKFDTDTFSGDWETTSRGKVIDFNLMTTGQTTGTLKAMQMNSGSTAELTLKSDSEVIALYVFDGQVCVNTASEKVCAMAGDTILLYGDDDIQRVMIHALDNSEIIRAKIKGVTAPNPR